MKHHSEYPQLYRWAIGFANCILSNWFKNKSLHSMPVSRSLDHILLIIHIYFNIPIIIRLQTSGLTPCPHSKQLLLYPFSPTFLLFATAGRCQVARAAPAQPEVSKFAWRSVTQKIVGFEVGSEFPWLWGITIAGWFSSTSETNVDDK